MTKQKKYIIKEQTGWVKLSASELAELLRNESAFKTKMDRQGCQLKKVGTNSWYKNCDGSTQPPPPTQNPPTSLSKYVGTYDGNSVLFPSFDIVEKNSKLYIKKGVIETELTNETGDVFKGSLGTDFRISFTVVGQQATSGVIIVGNNQSQFSRTTGGSGLDINWMEIAKGTWDALKKAGYWVKEEGGKLLAAIKDGLHVKESDIETWKCIDNYLKSQGFFKLMTGGDGKKNWRFTDTDFVHNKKYTRLFFYQDGKVEYHYKDTGALVPGYTGKWACGDNDKSFIINWDNGDVAKYGNFFQTGQGSNDGGSQQGYKYTDQTGAPKIKGFSQVCSSVLACPKMVDVEQGKKTYRLCMKCPEIEQLQQLSPLFQQIYFDLLEENGKKLQYDQYFGPIMEAAIKNFQETIDKNIFLEEWGKIGKNTLEYLRRQPDQPSPTPTPSAVPQAPKYDLTQDTLITNKTKF